MVFLKTANSQQTTVSGNLHHNRNIQIGVIGDSDSTEKNMAIAEKTGREIALMGATLVTGGGHGVMLAACRGAKSAGGLTVSIIPGTDRTAANEFSDVVIPSGLGWARNSLVVLSCDAIVVIGGRSGTLSELAYSSLYQKVTCAICGTGGWADRLAGEYIDNRTEKPVLRAESASEAIAMIKRELNL